MNKLTEQDGSSLDVVNGNLEALKGIFPEAFSMGVRPTQLTVYAFLSKCPNHAFHQMDW